MLYLIISILSLSLLDVTRKFVVRDCSPWLMTCVMCGFLASAFFVIGYFLGVLVIPTSTILIIGIFSGLVGLLGNIFLMESLKTVPLSITVPLLSFSSVWVVLIEMILLGVFPTLEHKVGIALVLLGSILLIHNQEGYLKSSKSLALPLLSSMCWGCQTLIDPIGIQGVGIWSWAFLICTAGALASLPLCFKELVHIRSYWKGLSMLGFWSGVGVMFQLAALLSIQPGVVETVKRGALLPLSLIFGKIFFKEDLTFRKTISIVLLIAGTIFATG